MSMEEGLVRLVQKIVRNEMDKQRVRTSEFVGRGGDTVISSMGNIYLQPGPNKAIYADGVEIPYSGGGGAGNLSNYMRKFGGGDQGMHNDIDFQNDKGATFYSGAGPNVAGALRAFNGINYYDFIVDSPNGYLYLDAGMGIRFAASAATSLDMGTNRILGVGAPLLVDDAARYKDSIIVCTSGTRPSNPTEGMTIYETDTDSNYKCTVGGASPTWVAFGGGVSDHGALTGLGDDDHTQYMNKDAAGGTQSMYNDIHFENLKGCVFYNTAAGANVAGAIRAFSGINYYDFIVDSPNGYLYLDAGMGIRFAASAATSLDMGSNKITSLATPTLDTDAATKAYVDSGSWDGGTVTNDIIISKANALMSIRSTGASSPVLDFRDSSGNTEAQLYTTVVNSDTVLVANYGDLYLATAAVTGGNIELGAKDTSVMTITDSNVTCASDVYIDSAIGGFFQIKESSTIKAYFGSDTSNAWVVSAHPLYIRTTGANSIIFDTNSTSRMTISDSNITSVTDIIISKANPLLSVRTTGASSPVLDFRDSSGNTEAQLYTTAATSDTVLVANYGDLYLATAATTGGNIELGAKDTSGMTITDTSISTTINVGIGKTSPANLLHVNSGATPSVSQVKTTANNAGGISLFSYSADNNSIGFDADYSSAWYARDTSAFLIYKIGDVLKLYGNSGLTSGNTFVPTARISMDTSGNWYPDTTNTSDLGTSSYFWDEVYAQKHYVGNTATHIANSTGDMVFTVAAGKKFKFVVSA